LAFYGTGIAAGKLVAVKTRTIVIPSGVDWCLVSNAC
jgi:hypothetical protein